jgi:hypothetical protein
MSSQLPSNQVRIQPVTRTVEGGLLGGLLGGGYGGLMRPPWQQQPYQSFNPNNSPSANMFDQYMQQTMQMYPGGAFPQIRAQTMMPFDAESAIREDRPLFGRLLARNRIGG